MAKSRVLITGGAGFIGSHLADELLERGYAVRALDALIPQVHGAECRRPSYLAADVELIEGDVRDPEAVRRALRGVEVVYHLAARVGVGQSMYDVAEYTSVNNLGTAALLDFRTPYGCAKGAADQYVRDYAHSFRIPAVVFRMSCIYGPRQLGTEDQGWLAHFLIRAIAGAPITIYGDGRQVRDVLFVDDLVAALVRAWAQIDLVRGRAFNIGGGPTNTLSLFELLDMIEQLRGERPAVEFEPWRESDQRYYVSDTRAFSAATGWQPRVGPRAEVEALHGWLAEHTAQEVHHG